MAALIEAAKAKDFPAEIVVVISNKADAGGLAKAKRAALRPLTIESKPFGKDRAAFEAALQSALDQHQSRSDLPRRIHAAVHGRIRAALVRPDAQHPSLAAAVVSRPRSARPGAARRGEDFRGHRAFRDSGNRCRPDRDAGRGRASATTTRRRRWRRGSSRSNTASIPMRCGWSRADRIRLEGDVCKNGRQRGFTAIVLISPAMIKIIPRRGPGVHHDCLRGS